MPHRVKFPVVIFDLFGTLVPSVQPDAYDASVRRCAEHLGADPEAFHSLFTRGEILAGRCRGRFKTMADCLAETARRLGVSPGPDGLRRAVAERMAFERAALVPRPDTMQTLRAVKDTARTLGLMSSCNPNTAVVWPELPFAPLFRAALLSCNEGVDKPDLRFYQLACERLGCDPSDCLYVGDGVGLELTGAKRAGMHPVLLCPPAEAELILSRPGVSDWSGPRVASLSDILPLLRPDS
jgi:putative hydrolase of the HAD superfamily